MSALFLPSPVTMAVLNIEFLYFSWDVNYALSLIGGRLHGAERPTVAHVTRYC